MGLAACIGENESRRWSFSCTLLDVSSNTSHGLKPHKHEPLDFSIDPSCCPPWAGTGVVVGWVVCGGAGGLRLLSPHFDFGFHFGFHLLAT
jgi:hypothetical protein